MNLPSIDISALPNLDAVTGIFGSFAQAASDAVNDDTLIIMMVFIYDYLPH